MTTIEHIAADMGAGLDLLPGGVIIDFGGYALRIRSNSDALLALMKDYFRHVLSDKDYADTELIAYERAIVDTGQAFIDWQREPGKTGRKDAYVDVTGGRVVLKIRTGMVFLQSQTHVIAAGSCLENDNQVINFIVSQYMNHLQRQGWMICHAAGLVRDGRALGMAGFSGGGKSTLMLHMLAEEGVSFLTNDRLFVHQEAGGTVAAGIPKLPRINPGTVINNPVLIDLISSARREELFQMKEQELWELEEKHDVDVATLYGEGKMSFQAPLSCFLILNWSRDDEHETCVDEIDLSARMDLLAAIMKSPGPIYQMTDGSMFSDGTPFDQAAYIEAMRGVLFYEVTGKVDFSILARHCLKHLLHQE